MLMQASALFWQPAPQRLLGQFGASRVPGWDDNVIRMCRITVGQWLGPSTCCHAMHALVSKVKPGGLCTHIVASPGGGAPVLYSSRCACCLLLDIR